MVEAKRDEGRLPKNRYPPLRMYGKAGGLLTALLFAAIWIGGEASAASYTVDNTGDAAGNCSQQGQCTLRTAIQLSNAAGGTNTVRIKPGTYKLTSGQLLISSHVTLTGADGVASGDASTTIVEGDGSHRLFEIQPGVNVAFEALTLQGGKAAPDSSGYGGGGVAAKLGVGNTLAFTNAVIRNNITTTSANPGYGGGLFVSGPATSKLVLANATFNANTAVERGGGVYAEGDLDIQADQAKFISNTASKQLGGGMAILSATPSAGTIMIRDSLFDSNAAQGVSDDGIGGGLYLNAPANILGTTFKGNTANSDGGGLFLSFFQKTTELTNVTFQTNTSQNGAGGGLFIQNGNPALTNTTFSGNRGASSPEFGTVAFPVEPFSPVAPMKTSDNVEYKGGVWTAKDVTVAGVDVSTDDGATWNPGPVSYTAEGTHKIMFKQADNAGNAVLQTKNVQLDKTKPTLSADITSDNASYVEGTWATKDVKITISATDNLSGVKSTKYSLNGGTTWNDYSVPVTLAADGTYTMQVQVVDQAGNIEEKSYTVKLDKTAPTLTADWKTEDNQTYTPGTWTKQPVTLTVTSSDGGSGLALTQYSLDGGTAWTDYTVPVTVTEGVYDVRVKASDQAGNTVSRNGAVKIDQTAPKVAAVLKKEDGSSYSSSEWSNKAVTLDASFEDSDGSGLNQKLYSLNGGTTWLNFSAPLNFADDGIHEVWLKGVDNVGFEDAHLFTIKVDSSAPLLGATVETASGANYPGGTWSTEYVTLTLNPSDSGDSQLAVTQYSLDNEATWTDYTVPVTVTDGVYAVRARTSDHAGNSVADGWSIMVDTIGPSLSIEMKMEDGTPYIDNTWASEPVAFKLEAADIGGSGLTVKQYSLNGGTTWTDYMSPVTVTDGVYHVSGRAVDIAGNVTERNVWINIDQTQPDLTVAMTADGVPYVSGTWTTKNVKVEATTDSAGVSVRSTKYSLDGGRSWDDYTAPIVIAEEGQNVIQFETMNQAGKKTLKQVTVNISRTAPAIVATQLPSRVTKADVTVTVTASAYGKDVGNTVPVLRYAQGTQSAEYFDGGEGIELPAGNQQFTVTKNDVYSLYAKDAAGNETVQEVAVSQIIRDLPSLQLVASPSAPTNGSVTVSVTAMVYGADKGNALTQLKWAEGSRDVIYFAGSGIGLNSTGGIGSFTAMNNGAYTVYAKDAAGNEALQEISVSQIIRDLPELQLVASPSGPTNGPVTVSVTATVYGADKGNALTHLKWAEGSWDTSYFAGSGIGLNSTGGIASFTATNNGAYTVYAKDAVGNEAVQTINIVNINPTAPSIELAAVPVGPANEQAKITVTVSTYGIGNTVSLIKWAPGTRDAGYFDSAGNKLAAGVHEFTVSENGIYTVYVKDALGIAAVRTITVTTIIRSGTGNQPPIAGEVQLYVEADSVGYGILAGSDPEGDRVTFKVKEQGTRGTLDIMDEQTGQFKYTPLPSTVGADTVTYAVYDNRSAVAYGKVHVTIAPKGTPGPSNRADLVSLYVSAGSLIPAFNSGVYNYNVSVPNEVNATTVTAVAYDSRAVLTVNGMKAASGSASPLLTLQPGVNSIAIVVTAADGKTVQAYTVTIYRELLPESPTDSDSSSPPASDGGTSPVAPPAGGSSTGKSVDDLGTVVTELVDGKTVITVTLDTERIEEKLKQSTEEPPVVTVRVEGSADRIEAVLNGGILDMLADRQAVLQVQSGLGNYYLPLAGIRMETLVAQFGSQANLSDIVLRIVIAEAPAELVERIQNRAREGQYTVVMPPIDFTVEAVYHGRTIEIHQFQRMVSREIPIPPEVDASRITTAVVAMADGTVHHVPTNVITRNDMGYLRINSLTNSTYAAISNMKTFADLAGHWAQREVNDMASRMIVNGLSDKRFDPDAPVTRAQFTAMIIRALGLSEYAKTESRYKDVLPTDWFEGAVAQAKAYGLIDGYEDGTFRPDKSITREEALVMIARAMKLAGKPVELTTADPQSILSGFNDSGEINEWALREAAEAVQSGLVQGSQEGLLPKSNMTRAETAVILHRLLIQSNLISP
ncbi:OmpL47-type beta-barrel domain-containing protein [Paenibacillus allorhizosphaerae]|uniref:SLH domain-containing protein n=1 Tax=Paenibacillus allorhizosphaerae TaxID=2849866 RepID=A0ABN7TLX9_9BACL|nr:S-layer homology domain-containing protein [Paenibacillus allorhizosphaerae]CAG7633722.1 hypothetical protein PAECIP111802_01976 [Paenibacillus allorhizosphaerae]